MIELNFLFISSIINSEEGNTLQHFMEENLMCSKFMIYSVN